MAGTNYNPKLGPKTGPKAFIDITGQTFHRLTAIRRTTHDARGVWLWEFRCECGTILIATAGAVKFKQSEGCGCLPRRDGTRPHGKSGTKEHVAWVNMWQRCSNPKNPAFKHYGERGITVCERWRSFELFLSDMGPAPLAHSLERNDNEQGYAPDNCRWATQNAQCNNTRCNHLLTHNGKTLNLTQWAKLIGIHYTTLRARLDRGWPISLALSAPVVHGVPLVKRLTLLRK